MDFNVGSSVGRRWAKPLAASGQLHGRHWAGSHGRRHRRALILLLSSLALSGALVAYVATRSKSTLLTWTFARSPLWIAIVVAALSLVFRIWVAVDAYMVAHGWPQPRVRSRRTHRAIAAATFVVLVAFIAVPHFFVVRYAVAQLDLLHDVFSATTTVTATPTPLVDTEEPSEKDSLAHGSTDQGSEPGSSSIPPETTVPRETWDGDERLTIALLGGDSGFDRVGVRTDTIILISIDVDTGDAAAFNIPRNWRDLTFPEGTPAAEQWPDGYMGIANEVYSLGLSHPDIFPDVSDPAGHAIKSAIAQLTGIPVQYYVLIDMVGFIEVVDLFGGIDLHVTEEINDRLNLNPPIGCWRAWVAGLMPGWGRVGPSGGVLGRVGLGMGGVLGCRRWVCVGASVPGGVV